MDQDLSLSPPKTKRPYHHGNLRAELIEAGLRLIESHGVAALTLREIGARAGVSRMAAYRHFANKEDLLAAIREAGFRQFADALEEARQNAAGSFAARLEAMAIAYIQFAVGHPAYYEVMFRYQATAEQSQPSPQGARAFGILVDTIRDGQHSSEVRDGDTVMLARLVWAQVHGVSTLPLEPDLGPAGVGRKFVQFCTNVLLEGLSRKNEQ